MELLFALILDPLRETFFQKALLGGSMVAIVCGVVGCLVILRRMSFLGDALSHAMIAGVAGGYLFMKLIFGIEAHAPAMLLGSLIAAVLTVALIGFVSRASRVKEDTAIGIMYTGVFAGGVVLVSVFRNYIHIDLMHFIMGDVLGVADADLWVAAIASALVLSVVILFFRHFQITSFDPVMAVSIGLPVVAIDYLLTTCVSLVVVSAVSMVGVILVVGLLITPAATAYLLSDRLDRMMALSALFGFTSVVGGLYLCYWLDSAGGGAIMLFSTFQFIVVLIAAPRYGLLARQLKLRRMVPQQLTEDILGTILREEGAPMPVSQLVQHLKKHGKVGRAVRNLTLQGLLAEQGGGISLTETGQKEALSIRRSHRIWETYLHHMGTPEEQIHPQAENLEHLHDNGTLDYLDDLLGHPVTDPHGKEIPQPHPEPGRVLALSVIREEGLSGVIASLPPALAEGGLSPGERIRVGQRRNHGKTWVVFREDGSEVTLDHSGADRLMIRFE